MGFPDIIDQIAGWVLLTTTTNICVIMWVLGYQRPFIKNFAAIAQPLHDLTKKDAPFNWTQECTDALKQLIQAVTSEPVLYQPDWSKQSELEVDASLFAIGAVLFQRDEEGRRRPISYFSQALNPAERNYDIWDREFLAVIQGLKHNRHLLVGSPHKVVVLTDHENLVHYRHPQKIIEGWLDTYTRWQIMTWNYGTYQGRPTKQTCFPDNQTTTTDQKIMRRWWRYLTPSSREH